jgi:hypothetical protein
MKISVEQVLAAIENDEFFIKIGQVDLSIGYMPDQFGNDHFADVMAADGMGYMEVKKFEGPSALERAVKFANKAIKILS